MFYSNTLNLIQVGGGTQVKQGDLGSRFSYKLANEKDQELDDFDKEVAHINLVLDDKIVFTTTATVDNSTVTFNIDKAIPAGLYFLEIKIRDYIFPSDKQTIIFVQSGAVAYDLKELVPNYDTNMTLKGILSDLSQKGIDISDLNRQLAQKANKDEVTNVMTPKGTLAYASLPTSGNQVGWYYYCPDGDGTHGAGNYVWNGTSWYFGGTGDEGYNLLNEDLSELKGEFDTALSPIDVYTDITNTLTWEEGYFWSKNGIKIEDSTGRACTLSVVAGQKYKITGYNTYYHRLYMLKKNISDNTYIEQCPPNSVVNTSVTLYEDVEITIPSGCNYLCMSGFGKDNRFASYNQYFKLEKVTSHEYITQKLESDVEKMKSDVEEIKLKIPAFEMHDKFYDFNASVWRDDVIAEQLKNDYVWKTPDDLMISFTFDDSNSDIDAIENLFETKGIPCCFATVPSRLWNICGGGETVKEVLQRCENNGGEILSHWQSPLTQDSTDAEYEAVYVGAKQTLWENGFTVNGIITAGGTNFQTQDFNKCVRLARPYYKFGDLTAYIVDGEKPDAYFNMRTFLSTDNVENKAKIDTFVLDGQGKDAHGNKVGKPHWLIIASHGANDGVTIDILTELIDYIQTTYPNVKIVTMNEAYEKGKSNKIEDSFAVKEFVASGNIFNKDIVFRKDGNTVTVNAIDVPFKSDVSAGWITSNVLEKLPVAFRPKENVRIALTTNASQYGCLAINTYGQFTLYSSVSKAVGDGTNILGSYTV